MMTQNSNNREIRSKLAKETLDILQQGFYVNAHGERVLIKEEIEKAIAESKLYSPSALAVLKEETEAILRTQRDHAPLLEVTDESSLEAAERLAVKEGLTGVVCLNFASAKNPGGGFLGGSQAQEESLARSSALYPCIAQMEEMYTYNRSLRSCFYSDYMIHSPAIPVFRSDDGALLDRPYEVSMITAPAVNAGVVREKEPEKAGDIKRVMLDRIRYIVSAAASHGHRVMLLGAYGCGVFRNHPEDVASFFKQVLHEEGYAVLFDKIVFAVLDRSPRRQTLNAFRTVLQRS